MNLFAPPIETLAVLRGILRAPVNPATGRSTADPALLLEARRRLWAALEPGNLRPVAAALGLSRQGAANLLQQDISPAIDGVPPLSAWRGQPGNPALQLPPEQRDPVYFHGRPRGPGEK